MRRAHCWTTEMKLRLHEYNLPLTHPFTISRGTITVQSTLIVELQQDGVSGFGEATVNAYYDAAIGDGNSAPVA